MKKQFAARTALLALAILSPVILAGCARPMATAGISTACSVWKPTTWSKKDTTETIAEIKVQNARRNGFCNG